ncbi:MAG: hypothetical protein O3B09_03430, partial [Proteobacteria bacterium]|nr:hypothetical protein [Pseudomonadota bacterium]
MLHFSKWKILLVSLICVFAVVFSIPNFIPSSKQDSFPLNLFPQDKVSLGLDLRGGSHLLLQIDFDFYLKEQLTNLRDELKKEFREKKIRSLPFVSSSKITFSLSDEEMIKSARNIIKDIGENVSFDENDGRFEIFFSDA